MFRPRSENCFSGFSDTRFDPECISGSGPEEACSYHLVITQLAEASYGQFASVNLVDSFDLEAEWVSISFEHGEKKFQVEFHQENDWFGQQALDLMN
jgi:hypothetical protein